MGRIGRKANETNLIEFEISLSSGTKQKCNIKNLWDVCCCNIQFIMFTSRSNNERDLFLMLSEILYSTETKCSSLVINNVSYNMLFILMNMYYNSTRIERTKHFLYYINTCNLMFIFKFPNIYKILITNNIYQLVVLGLLCLFSQHVKNYTALILLQLKVLL